MIFVGRNCIGCLALSLVLMGNVLGQAHGFLRVRVLEGDGAFNDIKHKIGHAMSVEVRDQNGQPVAGVEVAFASPTFGASGTFSNGNRTITAKTDMEGVAKIAALRPNATEGRFRIVVTVHQTDREGSAVITQSNSTAVVVHH
jgi:hypothetical protein